MPTETIQQPTQPQKQTEQSQPGPERAPGQPPRSPEEMWHDFKGQVSGKASTGARETGQFDSGKFTPEERKAWEERGELPAPKQEAKDGKGEAKPDGKGEGKQTAKPESEATIQERTSANPEATKKPIDVLYERAAKTPHFEATVQTMDRLLHPASGRDHAIAETMAAAIFREVPRSEVPDVLYALASNPETAAKLLAAQSGDEVAEIVRTTARNERITATLARYGKSPKASESAAKPRAPKPPSEVGGRGSSMGDPQVQAAKDGSFANFEAEEKRKQFGSRG